MALKWCTRLETTWKRCSIALPGHLSNYKDTKNNIWLILTQIGCFRSVTRVLIHRWLWNDAQSLKQRRRGTLFFSKSLIKFQGHMGWIIYDLKPIWVRLLGRSQLSNSSDLPCPFKSDCHWLDIPSAASVNGQHHAMMLWYIDHLPAGDIQCSLSPVKSVFPGTVMADFVLQYVVCNTGCNIAIIADKLVVVFFCNGKQKNSHKPGRSVSTSVAILTSDPAGTIVRFTTVQRYTLHIAWTHLHMDNTKCITGGSQGNRSSWG